MWKESDPLLMSVLHTSMNSFKNELLVENLAGIPILQQHGSEDDNVPAYHSRLMSQLLSETSWPSEYVELLGMGHWFDGAMETAPLRDFYKKHLNGRRELPMLPVKFSVVVPTSGDMGSRGGIIVDQLETPDLNGKIEVVRDDEESVWYMKTYNVHRLHLSADSIRAVAPSKLMLDDQLKALPAGTENARLVWFVKATDGSWEVGRSLTP